MTTIAVLVSIWLGGWMLACFVLIQPDDDTSDLIYAGLRAATWPIAVAAALLVSPLYLLRALIRALARRGPR